jgi:hypothetical protein
MSIAQAASAVIALINSKPTSPTQAEIEAILARTCQPKVACTSSPLLESILEAMAAHRAADTVAGRLVGDDYRAAEAKVIEWGERLAELEDEIPNPPRGDADIAMRAVLARYSADEHRDGTMAALDDGDVCDSRAARLIEAVLQCYGLDPAKPDAGLLGARLQGTEVAP